MLETGGKQQDFYYCNPRVYMHAEMYVMCVFVFACLEGSYNNGHKGASPVVIHDFCSVAMTEQYGCANVNKGHILEPWISIVV